MESGAGSVNAPNDPDLTCESTDTVSSYLTNDLSYHTGMGEIVTPRARGAQNIAPQPAFGVALAPESCSPFGDGIFGTLEPA